MNEVKRRTPTFGTGVFVTRLNASAFSMQVLIGKRAATNKRAPGVWALPGGFTDDGESITRGGRREVKEETDLDVDIEAIGEFQKAILGVSDHFPRENHLTFWLMCRCDKGNPIVKEPAKHECWKWWDLGEFFDSTPQVGEQVYWTPKDIWREILKPVINGNAFWKPF